MKICVGYMLRPLGKEFVVAAIGLKDQPFKGIIRLNDSGALLWKKLEEGVENEALLIDALCARYELDNATAARDVQEFLDLLRQHRLLTE